MLRVDRLEDHRDKHPHCKQVHRKHLIKVEHLMLGNKDGIRYGHREQGRHIKGEHHRPVLVLPALIIIHDQMGQMGRKDHDPVKQHDQGTDQRDGLFNGSDFEHKKKRHAHSFANDNIPLPGSQ